MRIRIALVPLVAASLVLVTPRLAAAHVEPDPETVPAGSVATVSFTLEHGCDGSPTTTMAFQVPDSVTDAQPEPKDGWTASVAGNVVTFAGGPQDAHEETGFDITFTAPSEEGVGLRFPVVQTCEVGEIAWIEASEEDDHPTPVVTVGPADASATTVTTETTTSSVEATTTTIGPTEEAAETSDDDSSPLPLILGGVVVLAVVGGGALALRARRSS